MCVAIYKPASRRLKYADMYDCWKKNNDGMGFAAAIDGQLVVHHELDNFEIFWKALKDVREYPCIVHFRWATHGNVDEANAHPFLMNHGSIAMAHNGIISEFCSVYGVQQDDSDTKLFVDKVLQPLLAKNPELLYNDSFQNMVAMAIGAGNKLAFLDAQGRHVIINKYAGTWEKGIWYSNMSWNNVTVRGALPPWDGEGTRGDSIAEWHQGDNSEWYEKYAQPDERICVYCGYRVPPDVQCYQVGEANCMCWSCEQSFKQTGTDSTGWSGRSKYITESKKANRFCAECGKNINLVSRFYQFQGEYYCMCTGKDFSEFKDDVLGRLGVDEAERRDAQAFEEAVERAMKKA